VALFPLAPPRAPHVPTRALPEPSTTHPPTHPPAPLQATRFGLGRGAMSRSRSDSLPAAEDFITQDYSSKLLHLSWHPRANVVATAASNSLYIFYGRDNKMVA
jgi:hypothetical protein